MQNKKKDVLVDFSSHVCPHCSRPLSQGDSSVEMEHIYQMFNESHYHLYLKKKKKALIYRIIFFGFSLLFFTLAFIIYFKTMNWASSFYLTNGELLKTCVVALCGILSCGAFGIGCSISPKKEAFQELMNHMDSSIFQILIRQPSLASSFALHDQSSRHYHSFQQLYTHTLNNFNEQTQKIVQLLERHRS